MVWPAPEMWLPFWKLLTWQIPNSGKIELISFGFNVFYRACQTLEPLMPQATFWVCLIIIKVIVIFGAIKSKNRKLLFPEINTIWQGTVGIQKTSYANL